MRDTAPRSIISILRDIPQPASAPTALATAARAATAIWLVVSAINFTVWLLICIFTGSFDSPWWLWAFAGGGALVGGLHLAAHSYRLAPNADDRDTAAETDGDGW